MLSLQLPSMREVYLLGALCLICVLTTGHFAFRAAAAVALSVEPWREGCRQCRSEWWEEFWSWRIHSLQAAGATGATTGGAITGGAAGHAALPLPPEGMDWEWGSSNNDTDWYQASAELVNVVLLGHADASAGPVLHIGCGDSPLPGFLERAGFPLSEHIDIAPEVITLLRARYPSSQWPGMRFEVRDFLAAGSSGGAPPPEHRFGAVVDKAGIWDWLQEEASGALPKLLAAVRAALVEPPARGVYIVATKQTPLELSRTLADAAAAGVDGTSFIVEATHPLGRSGVAWAYVLAPAP